MTSSLLGILLLILKALFKKDKTVVRMVGVILSVLLMLWSFYTILVSAALLGVGKSNIWTI